MTVVVCPDLTRDKSDPKDAVLIARLASELRCTGLLPWLPGYLEEI